MSDRMRAAEYLFDELGLISDSVVAEAMATSVFAKRKASYWRRAVSAVAAAAVILTLALGVFAIGFFRDKSEAEGGDAEVETKRFEELLVEGQDSAAVKAYASAEEVGLFDGQTKLIWQSEESADYYSLTLTREDTARLERALKRTYAESRNTAEDYDAGILVWISYGDGKVVSPYLAQSEGNVGYGELFVYSPEIIPSQEFAELMNDLISE